MVNSRHIKLETDEEIQFLQRARHPRLVLFLGCGYFDDDNATIFIVLEHCSGGNLQEFLYAKPKSRPSSWKQRLTLLSDVADGMSYLHCIHGSIHRDLKSANCLLARDAGGDYRAKVADFGLSRLLRRDEDGTFVKVVESKERSETMNTITSTMDVHSPHHDVDLTMTAGHGTPVYMAPELCCKANHTVTSYSQKVDVYAFGMIMWEAQELVVPWSREFENRQFTYPIFQAVERGDRPKVIHFKNAPDGFAKLMKRCWAQEPRRRPAFNKITNRLRDMLSKIHDDSQHSEVRQTGRRFVRSMTSNADSSTESNKSAPTLTSSRSSPAIVELSQDSVAMTSFEKHRSLGRYVWKKDDVVEKHRLDVMEDLTPSEVNRI